VSESKNCLDRGLLMATDSGLVGTSCTAQGIVHPSSLVRSQFVELCLCLGSLRQIGEYASFYFVVAMGIHTFNALVLRNRPPYWLGAVVTSIGWASALVIGPSMCTLFAPFHSNAPQPGFAPVSVTSDVNGPFYNIDGITCDISRSYGVAHMLLYFLPVRFPRPDGRSSRPHDSKSCSLRRCSL
jgi:hypothetical protein